MWNKRSLKIKTKVILEVSLDLKIYFIYTVYSYCMKKSSILVSVVFFAQKLQNSIQWTPGYSGHVFQELQVFALDRFDCMLNNFCRVLHSIYNYMFQRKRYLFYKLSFVFNLNLVKLGRSFVPCSNCQESIFSFMKQSFKASFCSNALC